MRRRIMVLIAALTMLQTLACAAAGYDVILPYDPIDGCEWSYSESREGIVRCIETAVGEDAWDETRENITFTFEGIEEGSTDLFFRYLPDGDSSEQACDAWLIRLCTDAELNVTEEPVGTCEVVYDSYRGGGPEYEVILSDDSVVHMRSAYISAYADSDMIDGGSCDYRYTFSGRKPGRTAVTVIMHFIEPEQVVDRFFLNVDDDLFVTREEDPEWVGIESESY